MTQTARRLVIVAVAIVFVLPLAMVQNMAKLAKTSALSIAAVVWIVGVVFVRSFTGVTDDVPVPTSDAEMELKVFNDNFFPAIGAISFAFTCHHSTFLVFNSLEVGCCTDVRPAAACAHRAHVCSLCRTTPARGGASQVHHR